MECNYRMIVVEICSYAILAKLMERSQLVELVFLVSRRHAKKQSVCDADRPELSVL